MDDAVPMCEEEGKVLGLKSKVSPGPREDQSGRHSHSMDHYHLNRDQGLNVQGDSVAGTRAFETRR